MLGKKEFTNKYLRFCLKRKEAISQKAASFLIFVIV